MTYDIDQLPELSGVAPMIPVGWRIYEIDEVGG